MAHICGIIDRQFFLQSLGHTRQNKYPFKIGYKFFSEGVVLIFWHTIVHKELLYCMTKVELVWTRIKVAVVEMQKSINYTPLSPTL